MYINCVVDVRAGDGDGGDRLKGPDRLSDESEEIVQTHFLDFLSSLTQLVLPNLFSITRVRKLLLIAPKYSNHPI